MVRLLREIPSIQHLLILALLGLAGVAASAFMPGDVEVALWLLAMAAGLLGILLALMRAPDSLSHLVAIGSGFGISVSLAAARMAQDAPGASFRDRVEAVSTQLWDWYVGSGAQQQETNDLLVGILLQMIVWLGGYLAAWALVRQGWVTVAIVLPGTIVFAARVAGVDTPPYLLEIAIVLAVMLLARTTYLRRRMVSGARPAVDSRGWVSLLAGTVVGVLVVSIGVATPEDFSSRTLQPIAEYAGDTALRAQDQAADWVAEQLDLGGSGRPGIDDYPRYTAFDDAFSIGGDLNLSDQAEVLVRTEGDAPYVTAQSYDRYTGRGWESTVEETFDPEGPDGVRYAPELTFRAGQEIPYSPPSRGERGAVEMEVTPLGPPGDTVFSAGQYLTADERVSVRMSWRQLDATRFPLREMPFEEIPPDLSGIASLLMRAPDLTTDGDSGLLYPRGSEDRQRLQEVRAQLEDRFIEVSWTVGNDGRVMDMIVTGQVPVYDDNVAVERTGEGGVNDPYRVRSQESLATEDDLRTASTAYPSWVSSRYLPLPQGVTERTVSLTQNLAASAGTPYDQARVIEAFLREHITYDIEVGIPEEGTDIVDYVLFELQRGYCEHYASAMTVMLRILGIPAKTVVGYFPGEWDDASGGYVYRQLNAHAWTEAYFPGYGWIRFEPTASQPAAELPGPGETPAPQTPEPPPTLAPSTPIATPAAPAEAEATPVAAIAEPVTADDGGAGGPGWPALVAAAAGVVAAAAVAGWWLLSRSPALEPRAIFGGLIRWGRAGGVRPTDTTTPREYARSVGQRYPQMAGDAERIVDVYEEQRYGGRSPERSTLQQAADALRNVQRAVIRRIVRLGRS